MNRYALRFGYSGKSFSGYQIQPNCRTVEGDILKALYKLEIILDPRKGRFQSASRTDRGVSALCNVVAFDTDFKKSGIIPALNANLEDIWFYAVAGVNPHFNPRYAERRIYRYMLPNENRRIDRLKKAGELFIGNHDFCKFSYPVKGKYTRKSIEKIAIVNGSGGKEHSGERFVFIDIYAQSFLWGMVRRIVSAMLGYENKSITLSEIKAALRGEKTRITGTAPPEPLILMDIQYPCSLSWEFQDNAGAKKLENKLKNRIFINNVDNELFSMICDKLNCDFHIPPHQKPRLSLQASRLSSCDGRCE